MFGTLWAWNEEKITIILQSGQGAMVLLRVGKSCMSSFKASIDEEGGETGTHEKRF